MRSKHFQVTDTTHLEFLDSDVYETREICENVYVDLDQHGNLLNMAIEHAKANAALWEFSYPEMAAPAA